MNTQISKPVKIFAAVMGVLILGVLGMTMMKGGSSSSGGTPTPAVTQPAVATPAPAPATRPAAPAAASKAAPAHAAAPAAKPHAATPAKPHVAAEPHVAAKPHVVAKPKPKPVPAVAADGLPGALDELLHIHQAVVVAVYDPEVPTDKLFVAEAQAGAQDAKAGFLAVSVLNERVAGPLTAAAGGGSLLPSPGLLLYKAPSSLMNVITGFIDRDAVSAAVANALTASAPNAGTTTAPAATPATAAAPVPTATTATP